MDYTNEPHGIFFMIDSKSFYASVESVERGENPLEAVLVVMSEQENTNGGLVLAASPQAKQIFGISNVDRRRDLPDDSRLTVVPPRMNLYIRKSLAIKNIFTHFASEEDVYQYSIDEAILDVTHSWKLFGTSPLKVAQKIQDTVRQQTGIYTSVGIGENPVQAKLALDLFAKHAPQLIGELNYPNFAEKLWPCTELAHVWSIGKRTAQHLERLGIHSIGELAHFNPFVLKKELGIIGTQLFALAWGIDRTCLRKKKIPHNQSLGNSQVLPRDYCKQAEIEIVIKEIGQQVAARLRHRNRQTGCIRLGIGFALSAATQDHSGFAHELSIPPTDETQVLNTQLLYLFRSFWQGEPVRHVSVAFSKLSYGSGNQLNFFEDYQAQAKKITFNRLIDQVRDRYGVGTLMYANSLLKGGTFIQRNNLVGGHNGGNTFE
ncbi:Y-family DNA polymerase [Liquorilactobacillus satsumensis]|uniref:Y-family DNA polymerase n=1 Tax=Liquorilactobacillus satsumensis TaxID=259059 RepID=UPI001E329CBD|nr:Y-family DNA polymerase [Liquorilactobacillus satsumensis]MCC7666384.1 excinuclease ABC subunit A [Liquorilactobacillus satsumensis]MCP9313103.1 Y-family DNA polymerase [Liquorilactobacillus satsumensis]MCP9358350.1 Y-family DNA polymerase [Liquorilactobacillus satsumensis]MCP9359287.1 Y-family DNA polymerase [Liquorilactobacillus satsumensis]MCP9372229.1 Y-family DNA polymerase [Liquorilactobacillus satsumensis]